MSSSAPSPHPALPPWLAWFVPWRWFPGWKPWQRWTVCVAMLPVGYVLSAGPMVWLHDRQHLPQSGAELVEVVYAPLGWACSHSTWFERPMSWYISLWESLP
jgi:hypothetical protein